MSMSTHVIGFKPPDDHWKEMKAVWDACKEADVQAPDEVSKFFDYEHPDAAGVEIDLDSWLIPWKSEGQEGYEIEISELPKDIKTIRFFNSY